MCVALGSRSAATKGQPSRWGLNSAIVNLSARICHFTSWSLGFLISAVGQCHCLTPMGSTRSDACLDQAKPAPSPTFPLYMPDIKRQ